MISLEAIRFALLAVTRAVMLASAILGFYLVRPTLKLNNDTLLYDPDTDTYTAPMLLCDFSSIEYNDSSITFDADNLKCSTIDAMVIATVASLIFTSVATLFFIIVDTMSRRKMGPFNKSTVLGMGIFVVFLLAQTGFTTGALYFFVDFWQDVHKNSFESVYGESVNVTTYGNEPLLWWETGLLALSSVLVFIEGMFNVVCKNCGSDIDSSAGVDLDAPVNQPPPSVQTFPGENNSSKATEGPSWTGV